MFDDENYEQNVARIREKSRNWGKTKFNPKRELDNATPCSQFKAEMEESKRSVEVPITQEEVDFKKERERNYRKMMIEENCKQPFVWDNFEDKSDNTASALEKKHKKVKKLQNKQNKKFPHKKEKMIQDTNSNNSVAKTGHKNPFKKKVDFKIKKNDLVNFDARNLSFDKQNFMRTALTKASSLKGTNLQRAVDNLKRRKEKNIL